ncbi:MAG TPA: Trk system potassium transporter TrkA [Solirubrobacterales bacterium]|nr:Trk system potassium transporter TrkA [Solirubrobacterales bacterium]
MKVIVIGAGEVGVNVARTLSADGHDVTVVDINPERCRTIQGDLDVLVVEGNGASPRVLREVGAGSVDLLAAVSDLDEVNIIAALGARQLGARTTVARVRDPDFFGGDHEAFARDVLGIDFVIDPDRATASDIADAILLPGAVSVEYFGDGKLAVAEMIVTESSPLVGVELANRDRPHPAYIVGMSRAGDASLIRPEVVPEVGDHLLVTVPTEHVRAGISHLAGGVREVRDCVIFGGGKIGLRLAELLERTPVRVTLLERAAGRARYLAERLPRTRVLHDEGVSREAQEAAGVDDADAFVASAGEDRANLLAALHAKRLGADLCLSVVSREEFTPLVDALAIDASYSPRLIAAEAILRFVHTRTVRAIHLLRTGFEAIELEAEEGAKIVGKGIGETHGMLRGCRVGAILRDREAIIPQKGTEIRAGDRVLMLGVAGALTGVEPVFARQG